MFYAHYVLNKKGPLARIWLAAHWDKKLTKANVFETNIEKSVEGILQPKVKLALRTSGHLMLGVVRIYSKKEKYLLADCNEAFVKIKMAFRPGMVDLPEEKREAAVNAITLPEVFHDFDSTIPELNDVDIQAQFSFNQSRAEEITMREDYGNISLVTGDDGFGDMGFGGEPPELMRDASSIDPSVIDNPSMLFDGGVSHKQHETAGGEDSRTSRAVSSGLQLDAPVRDDGFGGALGHDMMAGGLFDAGLFDDAPMAEPTQPDHSMSAVADAGTGATSSAAAVAGDTAGAVDRHLSDDDFSHYDAPASPLATAHSSEDGSRAGSPVAGVTSTGSGHTADPTCTASSAGRGDGVDEPVVDPVTDGAGVEDVTQDQTTLVHNEDETFALPPIDTSTLKGLIRTKRKRKLIVDEVKNISGEEMKNQLSDTSDIVTTLDLAPPTKRLMHWKETGGVEKLFALPARGLSASHLSQLYVRHLSSRAVEFDEFEEDRGGGGGGVDDDVANRHQQMMMMEQARDCDVTDDVHRGSSQHQVSPLQPSPVRSSRRKTNNTSTSGAVEEDEPSEDDRVHQQLQLQQLQLQQQLQNTRQQEQLQNPLPDELSESANNIPPAVSLSSSNNLTNMGYDGDEAAPANLADDTQPPTSVGAPGSVYSGGAGGGAETPWHQPGDPDFDEAEQQQHQQQQQQQQEEEQLEGETDEQYEHRVNNRRAAVMMRTIETALLARADQQQAPPLPLVFSSLCLNNNRKQVSQKFYTTLVLKKLQAIHLEQSHSYAEVVITQGPNFGTAQL